MPPLPKRKISTRRQGKRRAVKNPALPTLIPCPSCGQLKKPHRVCPSCGKYKDENLKRPKT